MIHRLLISFAILLTTAFGANALACSCMTIANAQQAAQGPNMIVAKVSTTSVDQNSGVGTLTVEKVIKGQLTETVITVQGQDGANCGSDIFSPDQKSWMVVLAKFGNEYSTAGCANASLPIDAQGNVQMYLNTSVKVTELEFSDLVNKRSAPSVKGLSCYASVSRNYIANDDSKGNLSEINFGEYVSTPIDQELDFEKDLTAEGLALPFRVYASIASNSFYTNKNYVSVRVSEPFYGFDTSRGEYVDVTETSMINYVGMSAYKYVATDGSEEGPFYAYDVGVQCNVDLGLPLTAIAQ